MIAGWAYLSLAQSRLWYSLVHYWERIKAQGFTIIITWFIYLNVISLDSNKGQIIIWHFMHYANSAYTHIGVLDLVYVNANKDTMNQIFLMYC